MWYSWSLLLSLFRRAFWSVRGLQRCMRVVLSACWSYRSPCAVCRCATCTTWRIPVALPTSFAPFDLTSLATLRENKGAGKVTSRHRGSFLAGDRLLSRVKRKEKTIAAQSVFRLSHGQYSAKWQTQSNSPKFFFRQENFQSVTKMEGYSHEALPHLCPKMSLQGTRTLRLREPTKPRKRL